MTDDIIKIKDIYTELLSTLKKEGDESNSFILNQVKDSLSLIYDFLRENRDCNNLFVQLNEIYKSINQPRIGLSDFFIE